jgi:cell division septal protein FtsQ
MFLVLKWLRWPIAILCLCVLVLGGVLVFNSQWVKIEAVQIDLAKNSNEDLLFQRIRQSLTSQFKSYEGRYFWQVPLKTVFEITSKDKRVKAAAVFREFPSRLRIEIEPHTPMLAYLARDGRIYPVATDATLLPALQVADAPDLPLLRGDELNDELTLREKALELLQTFPDDGLMAKYKVSEIIHTKKDGFNVFINGADAEVQMGDTDFGPKVSRVQKVLGYLDSRNIKGRVIDARFSKKVVVRVRKAP